MSIRARLTDGKLILEMDAINPPRLSSTGKSHLIASSEGLAETDLVIDGQTVCLHCSVFYKRGKERKEAEQPSTSRAAP